MPNEAFERGEGPDKDEEKHARLLPHSNISRATRKAIKRGKGDLGKEIRTGVSDQAVQENLRRHKANEEELIARIDAELEMKKRRQSTEDRSVEDTKDQ